MVPLTRLHQSPLRLNSIPWSVSSLMVPRRIQYFHRQHCLIYRALKYVLPVWLAIFCGVNQRNKAKMILKLFLQFEKMEYYAGNLCEVWKNVTQVDHKKNTYRLWVTRPEGNDSPATPHHYEMMGFNTLLGSHYDKYLIDYSDFSPQIDSDIFKLPGGKYNKLITHKIIWHFSATYKLSNQMLTFVFRNDLWWLSWSWSGA